MTDFQRKLNNILGQTQDILGGADAVGELFGIPDLVGGFFGRKAPEGQFSVSNFIAHVNQSNGLLKNNLFLANVGVPSILGGSPSTSGRINISNVPNLITFCDSGHYPTMNFATDDTVNRYGYGPIEVMPYKPLFTPLELTFLGDGKGQIYRWFQRWFEGIVNYRMSGGFQTPNADTGALPYELEYKVNYVAPIQIASFNENTGKVIENSYLDAFPVAVNDIPVNWADTDQLMRISVRFVYRDFYTLMSPAEVGPYQGVDNMTFYEMLQKGGSIAQVVGNLKKPKSVKDVINVVNNANILKNNVRF